MSKRTACMRCFRLSHRVYDAELQHARIEDKKRPERNCVDRHVDLTASVYKLPRWRCPCRSIAARSWV